MVRRAAARRTTLLLSLGVGWGTHFLRSPEAENVALAGTITSEEHSDGNKDLAKS